MKAIGTFLFLFVLALAAAAVVFLSPAGKTMVSVATQLVKGGDLSNFTATSTTTSSTPAPAGGAPNDDFAAVVDAILPASAPDADEADTIMAVNSPAPDAEAPATTSEAGSFMSVNAPAADTVAAVSSPAPKAPVATPTVEAPRTIEELARQPKAWPLTVYLAKAHEFPVIMGGQKIGSADVPAGTRVKLIAVQPDKTVTVDFNGGRTVIPAADTDLARQLKPSTGKAEPPIVSAQLAP